MPNLKLNIPATLVIEESVLLDVLQKAMAISQTGQAAPPEAEVEEAPVKRKPGRPKKVKPEAGPAQDKPKDQDLHLKIDFDQPMEIQFKSAIVQAAMQSHGDAIGRKIMQNWDDEDTKAVQFSMALFSQATLQSVAKAAADMPESELVKPPRLFLAVVFNKANELASVAIPVAAPKPVGCGVCEGVSTHKAGCPVGVRERMAREAATDGGAIPSRVPSATPTPRVEQPEVCNLGGAAGGCPIPQHGVMLQGGAHIPVHPPEVMRALRAATMPSAAAPQFSMPQPPKKRGPGRPKKTK